MHISSSSLLWSITITISADDDWRSTDSTAAWRRSHRLIVYAQITTDVTRRAPYPKSSRPPARSARASWPPAPADRTHHQSTPRERRGSPPSPVEQATHRRDTWLPDRQQDDRRAPPRLR